MSKGDKEFNVFYCETCGEPYPEMSKDQALEHLKTVHGIEPGTSAARTMVLHVDGTDFYKTKYAWDFGAVKLTQEIQRKRSSPWG
jgi:hypothetical protein